jgi:mannose-6-phosphate isomerase-like protein (cupin superfamily)
VNIAASAAGLALSEYLKLGRLNDHVLTVIRTEERVLDFNVHEHSDEMFFVAEGSMAAEFDDRLVTLEAGGFIAVPAGMRYRPVCHAPVTCLLIEKDGTVTKDNTGSAL